MTVIVSALGSVLPQAATHHPDQPAEQPARCQAYEIPPNSLYLIEWYPNGCGNGNGRSLTGGEETPAACVNPDSLWEPGPADTPSVRFLFPDDRVEYHYQLFGTNGCSREIFRGSAKGPAPIYMNVPNSEGAGAVIVFT